ncbi:replication protein RepA [Acidisphaera sp. L21]|uniref:replication protein RepA n=1 Tax=Acidisphaera sp. L21 TaxID=1641851 RepID=UPI0020B134F6|nr:replication protein RepA [Acidisphaera sp. L21]
MGTVHDLLVAKGKQATRGLVDGRRGARVVEAAAAWSADEDTGTGYMFSGWCQTALPHKRPTDNSSIWKLETDSMMLLVEPGVRVAPGGTPMHVGVPFGAIARLILIYLQSEALRTSSRDVELGGSLRAFLGRLGISVGGDDSAQGTLFVETARLSETFFNQLKQHAVPLDESAIRHTRNSSMALNVYCWLAYRLHSLSAPKEISWAALAGQFGAGIQLRKHFKPAFTESLVLAQAV